MRPLDHERCDTFVRASLSRSHANNPTWQASGSTSGRLDYIMARKASCGMFIVAYRRTLLSGDFKVYISGNSLVILGGPQDLIQTTFLDECDAFHAVSIDENSGKIAVSSSNQVHVFKPYGLEDGMLKVTRLSIVRKARI